MAVAVMKLGKLQQTGTPADIYRRPVSRFVADFIGESNFLPATIDQASLAVSSSGLVRVNTAAGILNAFIPQKMVGLPPNTPVLAAFRPEAVSLRSLGGNENRISANRVSTTYLGEIAEHLVELPGGQKLKAFELNPGIVGGNPGEEISLFVPAENIMLVDPA